MTTFRANGLNRNKVFSYTVEPSSLWTVPVLLALEIACPSVLDCGAPTIWKKILQKIVATVCSLWTSQKVTTCFLIAGSIFKDLIITSEQMIESCMIPCNRRNQRNFLIQMSTVNHESVLNCLKLIFVKGTCVMHQTSGQSLMSMKNRLGAHKIV